VSTVPAIIRWDQAYNRNGDAPLPREVVNVIRTYMNNHTLEGWVKAETLADHTGLKVRQVRRQIAANVAAGWLEITASGNSSGLANSYRLTYPKGVIDDTVHSAKGVIEDTLRVSCRAEKGVMDDTPTTPLTSPGTSPKRSTSPEKGVMDDTLPDPWGSEVIFPANPTTEFKGVMDDTLANGDTDDTLDDEEIAELMDEIHEETDVSTLSQSMTALSDEDAAEGRLRAAMAAGPIPAWTARDVAGVPQPMTNAVLNRLIDSGVVIHDKDARQLSLT
jgi:hypothetical protein